MQVSIIIVTYNRAMDLEKCLDFILFQTILPKEVIIVDNGNSAGTEQLIKRKKDEFETKAISLKYIENNKENSLTVGRNIGAQNAKGEIVVFLDDDVVLDKDYTKEILALYEYHSNALGVHGYITNLNKKFLRIKNLFGKCFFLGYVSEDECNILPSVTTTYPVPLNKIIPCQWLSGANHSYKRQILEEFKYDEKLKKWSQCEDIDFSYRVFKKYPGSLYITPYAKLTHRVSPEGRMLKKELTDMCEIYELYFFYKNIEQTLENKLIYLWSRVGKLIFNILRSSVELSKNGFIEDMYLIKAYINCLHHIKEIKDENIEFFNKRL